MAKSNGRAAGETQRQRQQQQESLKQDDDVPACQSCRRKKARCSREQPCSQCVRFQVPCIYDDRRLKPGLRAGAIDQLYRRIDTLENMFLGQEFLWKQMWETLHPDAEFPGLPGKENTDSNTEGAPVAICDRQEHLKNSLLKLAATQNTPESNPEQQASRPAKRQRTEATPSSPQEEENLRMSASAIIDSDLITPLVEFYFQNIHHWIPILHVRRFRNQIQSKEGRQRVIYILHAIIAVSIRFSQNDQLGDADKKARVAENSRQKVILCSMESFSVENLQALTIIAFDTIARGRGPSSWSIVGSMARTVEQLQLSVEEDDLYSRNQSGETLIRRIAFLKPSTCWRESEERRRVFWTVFLMDRFCSLSTGWNVSLTSADVKRRLPCEGAMWEHEDEARAPYFGISDSKGSVPHRSLLVESQITTDPMERDCIGGFAYCIEATESLALVTNFFLHHALDVRDVDKTQLWLMRFKELDLRLVQWKLFLPSKWREASTLNADGIMDSNLTLAHITHNTAVILLHQAIAYPPLHWQSCPVKLPSSSSAETCIEAASEISTIGQQFLLCSSMLTNPQFSFCLFIAGRMLLTHSKHNNIPIPVALDTLIASLFEISGRWAGPRHINGPEKENLASGFAKRLVHARDNSTLSRGSLDIRQTVYSEQAEDDVPQRPMDGSVSLPHVETVGPVYHLAVTPDQPTDPALSLAFPPLPLSFQQSFASFADPDPFNLELGPPDALPTPLTSAVRQPPDPNGWNPMPVQFYPRMQDTYSNGSPGSAETLSPGQRISRYGGVPVEEPS